MRKRFFALLLAAAFLPACESSLTSVDQAKIDLADSGPPVFTGSPASVVEMHGTATNSGKALARDITVTAYVGGHVMSRLTNPSALAPGETATWSVKLAGSTRPTLTVSWR